MSTTIHTEHTDFRCDGQTVTLPRELFAVIADQLSQYQAYAEAMTAIGRGLNVSSPFGPETTAAAINYILAEARKGGRS
jgi:hypothetical protein